MQVQDPVFPSCRAPYCKNNNSHKRSSGNKCWDYTDWRRNPLIAKLHRSYIVKYRAQWSSISESTNLVADPPSLSSSWWHSSTTPPLFYWANTVTRRLRNGKLYAGTGIAFDYSSQMWQERISQVCKEGIRKDLNITDLLEICTTGGGIFCFFMYSIEITDTTLFRPVILIGS